MKKPFALHTPNQTSASDVELSEFLGICKLDATMRHKKYWYKLLL